MYIYISKHNQYIRKKKKKNIRKRIKKQPKNHKEMTLSAILLSWHTHNLYSCVLVSYISY